MYAFFWVIPLRLNFIWRRFETFCLFHLHRRILIRLWRWNRQCSEMSAYKIQKPGNYPEESTQLKYITQLDATISPVYYLTFIYNSTCFGRPHAHHQELNNCRSSLWFYRWSVVIVVLLFVVGPDNEQKHCYHHAPKVKPEAATAVVELLMMGVRTPKTFWAVNKRQVINWRNCWI